MNKISRSEARVDAFAIIFTLGFGGEVDLELELIKDKYKDHKKNYNYIIQVVSIVKDNVEEIDKTIENNLGDGWSMRRLSKMNLAVLRLAVAEISYCDDIPSSVTINEAVEISKKYGDDNEPSFVNGILGKIVK